MSKSVLLITGEISGDMHAAGVVRAVRAKNPDIHFFGIGGDELRAAGMEILHHVRDMAVLGIAEVLQRYGFFRRVFREMTDVLRTRRPDAVMLVDYPGFNLRFAAEAKRLGIKVLYYVCPQVWAWHRSRVRHMAEIVDRLIVIFPFEAEVFAGTGLRVDFVGHPLVDEARQVLASPPLELPWHSDLRIALLPGSRVQEVRRILPAMIGASRILKVRHPDASFILAAPSEAMADTVREVAGEVEKKAGDCGLIVGKTRQVLRQARAAIVASGTATVEAALMDCPMIIAYRAALLTYLLGRMLIRVPHLGMVNIVAGRTLCPEFIQGDARPPAMADALEPLLADTPERAAMVAGLEEVRASLGRGGAAERAAAVVLEELA